MEYAFTEISICVDDKKVSTCVWNKDYSLIKAKVKTYQMKANRIKKNTVIRNQVLHTRAETSGTEAEVGLNFVGFYATLATRLGRRPIDIT